MPALASFRELPSVDLLTYRTVPVFLAFLVLVIAMSPWSSVPVRGKVVFAQLAAIAMLGLFFLYVDNPSENDGFWIERRRAPLQADRFLVAYLLLAFGFGLALHGLRPPWTPLRCLTLLTSTVLGVLIAAEASGKLHWAYHDVFPKWSWRVGVTVFVVVWLPTLFVLIRRFDRPERRRLRGECVACGYPLLNFYNCPECGTLRAGKD